MTESPRTMTLSGSAGVGTAVSRIGCWPAYPPAPGTVAAEPRAAAAGRCVVPTTLEGSATAGIVATTMRTAVSTPAMGAAHQRTQPRGMRQTDGTLDEVVARCRDQERHRDAQEVERPRGEAGARPVEVDDHRPVPEIDAVRDGPDEVQRPPGERGEKAPGSVRRASATTSAASAAQSKKPPSNMKFVGSPPGVPALTQNTASARAASGATTWSVRRAWSRGWGREAAVKAMVAPAMRSKSRVSVPK